MTTMFRSFRSRVAIVCMTVAALSLCSCVATNTTVMEQDTRIDQLEEEVQRLKRFVDLAKTDPVARPGADSAQFERLAELAQRVEGIETSLQQLSGSVEDLERSSQKANGQKPVDVSGQLEPLRQDLADLVLKVNALTQKVNALSKTSTGGGSSTTGKDPKPQGWLSFL